MIEVPVWVAVVIGAIVLFAVVALVGLVSLLCFIGNQLSDAANFWIPLMFLHLSRLDLMIYLLIK